MKYVFDTSSLIALFRDENYDRDVFPTLWKNFDKLVTAKRVVSVRESLHEIKKRDDNLSSWASNRSRLFHEPNGRQTGFIRELFDNSHFRGLIKHRRIVSGDHVADPFIIALAHDIQGCVVTQEKKKLDAPCIPIICGEYNVDCTDLIGFMKKERWSF